MSTQESLTKLVDTLNAMQGDDQEMKAVLVSVAELLGGLCLSLERVAVAQETLVSQVLIHKHQHAAPTTE